MDRILIVDDEIYVLNSLRRKLINDYEVFIAQSAKEGLEILSKHDNFTVIISDYLMPEMDGAEFFAIVKEKYDGIRILLTGYPELRVAEDAVAKGDIFLFLTKPCSEMLMKEALKSAKNKYHEQKNY